MPSIIEHVIGRAAYLHAAHVFRGFRRALRRSDESQARALRQTLQTLAGSEFARRFGLAQVRSVADLRQAVPLLTYEDLRLYIQRVADGEHAALFAPGVAVRMFATSSGTTSAPKLIPVTDPFIREYRRGWNTFGVRALGDHPGAFLRGILQVTGRHDESHSAAGIPCGAITGLLARLQKGIVRKFYVGRPEIAYVGDAADRYYLLARFGVVRDVSFAITANPGTLVRIAQVADQRSEQLLRDVRDGTIDPAIRMEPALRTGLQQVLRPMPDRARQLDALRQRHGALRPRDFWNLKFLACWTGGSMAYHLPRLAQWYGPLPVRDIGLLASEGRITLPIADGARGGPLDLLGSVFEFIPAEQFDSPQPQTRLPGELEIGCDYALVLTNPAGLVRYRLDDVVRMTGWFEKSPVLEFLHRGGQVSSVAGEKLTESQVVAAISGVFAQRGLLGTDFLLAPVWSDPPYYRLSAAVEPQGGLPEQLDDALGAQNAEYRSRRNSNRLGKLELRHVPAAAFGAWDQRLGAERGGTPEQYKRPCLLTTPGADDHLGLAASAVALTIPGGRRSDS